jgi:hypothetical protein
VSEGTLILFFKKKQKKQKNNNKQTKREREREAGNAMALSKTNLRKQPQRVVKAT